MGDKNNKRMKNILLRNTQAEKQQIKSEIGTCENEKPCVGPVCNKWDRVAEQCGIRSIGEAATILLEVFGPQIMAIQEGSQDNQDDSKSQDSGDENIT